MCRKNFGLLIMLAAVFSTAPLALQAGEHFVQQVVADSCEPFGGIDYELPEFSAGKVETWVKSHLIYPAGAFKAGLEGKVFITFIIGTDGLLHEIKVARSSDTLLNKAALEVVRKMPYWKPCVYRGVPVKMTYNLPVVFKCDEAILMTADEMPVFPQPLVPWLREKVGAYYKPLANESSIQGKSYVAFIIEKDGSLSAPEIVKSSGYRDMDEKALEIVGNMPRWTPGRHSGKPVRIRYTVPVVFAPFTDYR